MTDSVFMNDLSGSHVHTCCRNVHSCRDSTLFDYVNHIRASMLYTRNPLTKCVTKHVVKILCRFVFSKK